MSEKKQRDFKVGDYILWQTGGTWSRGEVWGQIQSISPKGTIKALPLDGEVKVEREFRRGRSANRKYDCRLPSELEVQVRVWMGQRPRGKLANVSFFMQRDSEPGEAYISKLDTAEKCAQAAKELAAVAKWWKARPQ